VQVTFAVTPVELDDGRLALLVEIEPDPGLGPLVIGPLGPSAIASQDSPEELSASENERRCG
jgi:hypothetical protein